MSINPGVIRSEPHPLEPGRAKPYEGIRVAADAASPHQLEPLRRVLIRDRAAGAIIAELVQLAEQLGAQAENGGSPVSA